MKLLQEQRDRQRGVIIDMRKELALANATVKDTRKQLDACKKEYFLKLRAAQGGLARAGGLISLFSREKWNIPLPLCEQQKAISFQAKWVFWFPHRNLTSGFSGSHVYGEPSVGTIARICHAIKSELEQQGHPLKAGDVLLDWGAGSGKWLLFAREFLGTPGMLGLGIECERGVYEICCRNLRTAQEQGFGLQTAVLHADATSFRCFCSVRVFLNYDGGFQKTLDTPKGRIHQTIMRAAFCSPSVNVIVSTRTNMLVFNRYFSKHLHRLGGSVWKCVYLPPQDFGGSHFQVNIWFRVSPMQEWDQHVCDVRLATLVAGFLLCRNSIFVF